ncbi:hypothetical protein GCM10017771_38530 [Streptomyces capitiformicae]|uniref:Uncharacterized protein n=1 Tax=Streptomyces capitiformicae TaxID=2014920 RepID=A0A919GRD2_9ACTN|nr:hypothetical protein GCM10017771_38530 [Streptomyces capitiformicae]
MARAVAGAKTMPLGVAVVVVLPVEGVERGGVREQRVLVGEEPYAFEMRPVPGDGNPAGDRWTVPLLGEGGGQ